MILTKDRDFISLTYRVNFKVVLLNVPNCSVAEVAQVVLAAEDSIRSFRQSAGARLLALSFDADQSS
jgi:predicted nuclease of predicted toxin-antitoxin system